MLLLTQQYYVHILSYLDDTNPRGSFNDTQYRLVLLNQKARRRGSGFNGLSYWKVDNAESFVYLAYYTSSESFPSNATIAAAAFISSIDSIASSPMRKLGFSLA